MTNSFLPFSPSYLGAVELISLFLHISTAAITTMKQPWQYNVHYSLCLSQAERAHIEAQS